MTAQVLVLIDANSFYCSCERVFDPKLARRPVIVLSNNDGCAIARTKEAKALGIGMGDPFFKIREMCRSEGVAVYSSNYTLYGDMSARLNAIYRQWAPDVEVYSIDESFLDLSGFARRDLVAFGRDLRATVRQWTGIPTCVGIGPTKTLAKLANHIAKGHDELAGVCDLTDPVERDRWLTRVEVGDVWGVGRASEAKLVRLGVTTAAQLRDMDVRLARKMMTVVGERTVLELRGIACLALEDVPPQRKGCAVTRSFGQAVTTLPAMLEAVAAYATRAGEKLRRHGLETAHMAVFMHTNEHNGDRPYYGATTVHMPEATNDTLDLMRAAQRGARQVWREGFRYAKAGIIMDDLIPAGAGQRPLFDARDRERSDRLMGVLDAVNGKFGRGTLVPAAAGIRREWQTKFEMRSPRYTTQVKELPRVQARTYN